MKQKSFNNLLIRLRICIAVLILVLISFALFSFTVHKMTDDFLKQLGITKSVADEKIAQSILGGSIDVYGLKNAKNIVAGNRAAVAKDILTYTKQHVQTASFLKSYNELRTYYKPQFHKVQTAEEMRQDNVTAMQKAVKDMEEIIRKADATTKPIFEQSLVDTKKMLKDAEDPNNKSYIRYAKGYDALVRSNQQGYDKEIADWEARYPANQLLFVKKRLQEFLAETEQIDFDAELTSKNGKKVFVNPAYESKGSRWKMAYRAGKGAITTARIFAEQWISEIK